MVWLLVELRLLASLIRVGVLLLVVRRLVSKKTARHLLIRRDLHLSLEHLRARSVLSLGIYWLLLNVLLWWRSVEIRPFLILIFEFGYSNR